MGAKLCAGDDALGLRPDVKADAGHSAVRSIVNGLLAFKSLYRSERDRQVACRKDPFAVFMCRVVCCHNIRAEGRDNAG